MSTAVVHYIVAPSEWPSPVASVAQILQRPLPAHLVTASHPSFSSRASELLQELSSSTALHAQEDSQDRDETSLAAVLDIVLSTVSDLRELVSLEDCGSPRPTAPLWFTLIKALGHACLTNVSIIGEVPFILPRAAPFEQRKPRNLDGVATMLLSHIVDDLTRPGSHSPGSPSDVKCGSDDGDVDDISMHYGGNSVSDVSGTHSIDVPFEAHVLLGRGRRFCAVLPLLCVADEDNIVPLLSSVLYQRRVWGIDEPVVGIIFSKTGTIGQVVLGWTGPGPTDDHNLPTINLARAITSTASEPLLGVFNLTEPGSSLSFAQFILGLYSHFRAVISRTSNPELHVLDWRSDHIAIDDQKSKEEEWKKRVIQWTHDVDVWDDSSDDSSRPHTPPPHELSSGLVSIDMPPKTSRGPRDKNEIKVPTERHAISSITPIESGPPSISLPADSEKIQRMSCSSYCLLSDGDLTGRSTLSTWLFERRALTIALIELSDKAPDYEEINRMIKLYDRMTKLEWPEKWTSLAAMPQVDPGVEADILDQEHVNIFEQRLSALLWATTGAYTLAATVKDRQINEAESRHDWDALLYRFFASFKRGVSPNVLLERCLRYPRNSTADEADSAKALTSQQGLAEAYFRQCFAQGGAFNLPVSVQDQAFAALTRANVFRHDLASSPAKFLETVTSRLSAEPHNGTCDALLVTPVPLGPKETPAISAAQEYLRTFGFVKLTRPNLHANEPSSGTIPSSPSHLSPASASEASHRSSPSASAPLPTKLGPSERILLKNPLGISSKPSTSGFEIAPIPALPNILILSGFVAEYKKPNEDEAKALNQERMYLVSLVTFLAVLGIKEFAVFGLMTSGQIGGIMMAWQSKTDKIYIIERNIRTFNLASPIDAFQFASFLIRVRAHTDTLVNLFAEKKEEFLEKALHKKLPDWTREAQAREAKEREAKAREAKEREAKAREAKEREAKAREAKAREAQAREAQAENS